MNDNDQLDTMPDDLWAAEQAALAHRLLSSDLHDEHIRRILAVTLDRKEQ